MNVTPTSENIILPTEEWLPHPVVWVLVIGYSVIFVISGIANIIILALLCRRGAYKTGVKPLILNLCIADLIMTFIKFPGTIGWAITVAWKGGNIACRIWKYLEGFSYYISAFLHVSICIDRCVEIGFKKQYRRMRLILISFAWIGAMICSIKQAVVFHTLNHPQHPSFVQCVTFHSFPSETHQAVFNVFWLISANIIPILTIIISYSIILYKMATGQSTDYQISVTGNTSGNMRRLTEDGWYTLMTFFIMVAYIVCITPSFILLFWNLIDQRSFDEQIDFTVYQRLLVLRVSSVCFNPIVFGIFEHGLTKGWARRWIQDRSQPEEDLSVKWSRMDSEK